MSKYVLTELIIIELILFLVCFDRAIRKCKQ